MANTSWRNPSTISHALAERIERITVEHPRRHWLARFDAAGIPCGPINNYAEAFADPQIRARGMVVEVEHPTLGRLKTPGSAIKMSETPPVVARAAPLLGEHTREVLRAVGYWTRKYRRWRLHAVRRPSEGVER